MEKVQFLWRVPALARPPLVDAKAHLGRRQSEGQPQKEGESGKQKVLSRRRAGDGTIVFTHAFRVKKRKEFTTPALSVQSSHPPREKYPRVRMLIVDGADAVAKAWTTRSATWLTLLKDAT